MAAGYFYTDSTLKANVVCGNLFPRSLTQKWIYAAVLLLNKIKYQTKYLNSQSDVSIFIVALRTERQTISDVCSLFRTSWGQNREVLEQKESKTEGVGAEKKATSWTQDSGLQLPTHCSHYCTEDFQDCGSPNTYCCKITFDLACLTPGICLWDWYHI